MGVMFENADYFAVFEERRHGVAVPHVHREDPRRPFNDRVFQTPEDGGGRCIHDRDLGSWYLPLCGVNRSSHPEEA